MAQAFGRLKGTEEWQEVTYFGDTHKVALALIQVLVMQLEEKFPQNEYKIEDKEKTE